VENGVFDIVHGAIANRGCFTEETEIPLCNVNRLG
jgi:hypothetical protein